MATRSASRETRSRSGAKFGSGAGLALCPTYAPDRRRRPLPGARSGSRTIHLTTPLSHWKERPFLRRSVNWNLTVPRAASAPVKRP